MHPQDGILGETEIKQQPTPVPVLGNVRNAKLPPLTRSGPRDVSIFKADLALKLRTCNQAGEGFNQFRLPVALNSRDAEDLAPAHLK